jgi:uncharacterized HAD superfamily protein
VIAVDICNTLADVNSVIVEHFKPISEQYPLPIPDGFWKTKEGIKIFKNALPLKNAAEVISGVSNLLGGVIYVTSRPAEVEFITYQWLKKHGFPKGRVIFCDRKEKLSVYSALQPCIIAEDDPEVINELEKLDVSPVLVYQWPYNRHLRGNNIIPIEQWDTSQERGVLSWR